MLKIIVCLLLSTGCSHGREVPKLGRIAPELQRFAQPPTLIEYERVVVAGKMQLPSNIISDRWEGPKLDGSRLIYDVTTVESGPKSIKTSRVRHFYDKQGYGYLGTLDEQGRLDAWQPAQLVLPAGFRVGQKWSATHQKGEIVSERSCELMQSNLCEDGVTSVCTSEREGGRILLRDHFCPISGWSGFEALIQKDDQPSVRLWSEGLLRNGQRVESSEPPEPSPEPSPAAEPEASEDKPESP